MKSFGAMICVSRSFAASELLERAPRLPERRRIDRAGVGPEANAVPIHVQGVAVDHANG